MDDSLRELYQDVILDHSRHPRHFGKLAGATNSAQGYNPLCGDRVTIYLIVGKDERIADVRFEGKGCAISQASASLMTDLIVGRTVAEAEQLMAGVSAFPMRVKCATLAWHTMKSALEGGDTAKTE